MIDAMGIGLIVPVMPDLIQEVRGMGLGTAALWGGVLSTTFAAMQFLFGPLLGALSDRYGRRPILLASLVVLALDYLVMAVAGTIWLLFLGRVVGGITAATQSTANAYMADISRPEDKAAETFEAIQEYVDEQKQLKALKAAAKAKAELPPMMDIKVKQPKKRGFFSKMLGPKAA